MCSEGSSRASSRASSAIKHDTDMKSDEPTRSMLSPQRTSLGRVVAGDTGMESPKPSRENQLRAQMVTQWKKHKGKDVLVEVIEVPTYDSGHESHPSDSTYQPGHEDE